MNQTSNVHFEFHVSRAARDRYQFDETLFASSGNVIFTNFHAARLFAQKMNAQRDLLRFPEQSIRAGQINALGLIDEMLHQVVADYRRDRNARVMGQALDWLNERIGADAVDATLRRFADEFPPMVVYRGEIDLDTYLNGATDGIAHREIVLEEMLMLWLTNVNPAAKSFQELFDDTPLRTNTAYLQLTSSLRDFFEIQPRFGPENLNLIDLLRAPALAAPDSLSAQLEFIVARWGGMLGSYVFRLLGSLDVIKEEEKPGFVGAPGGGFDAGPIDVPVYEYGEMQFEPEQFTLDRDWMPRVVLIAKNAYVWLDQLSKRYQRAINTLDQIPDEELDQLARWGVTGLWLIGLWERSPASRRIKQMMGQTDAVASAYSLHSYDIAADLGGWDALHVLKDKAWRRGIRLASDMVPNHMGIDSRWVIDHPNWFMASDHPPFPAYSYNGPDLSSDERVGIFIEDHYYDRSDAAVAFKRLDRWTGGTRYIYHGNDGTSLPWNDTAQLDYLNPEVREALIQTILHVARNFPIIRFDAAMTLAKKHYQRLWFPEPGTGGAIASRADYAMTKRQFDEAMPVEFWRELVDRAAVEAPDTLLLAEAFWMMEGYFVRTLGMHRVYNSAFMNILRDEENAKYREVMKNTLEFDPEILKRYVNFMNNPDERTAVEQFGKGEKYFGVCTVMATMPGMPMFGHGQIEGFSEKYGMEFRRPMWDEQPDLDLMRLHERLIFPLLHRRYLFAEVHDFLLYDFFTPDGGVNENVFAYSNRAGDERSLVVYHNKYASTRGWIRSSVAYAVKTSNDEKQLTQRMLGQGLGLSNDSKVYFTFRDHLSGLEYIRNSAELIEQGLYLELNAYTCHVFLDWRDVYDGAGMYAQLTAHLGGRGVPSIDDALREMLLQPILAPFGQVVNTDMLSHLSQRMIPEEIIEEVMMQLVNAVQEKEGGIGDVEEIVSDVVNKVMVSQQLFEPVDGSGAALKTPGSAEITGAVQESIEDKPTGEAAPTEVNPQITDAVAASAEALPTSVNNQITDAVMATDEAAPAEVNPQITDAVTQAETMPDDPREYLHMHLRDTASTWGTLLGWLAVHDLGRVVDDSEFAQRSRSWIDEWFLGRKIARVLNESGLDDGAASRVLTAIRILTEQQNWFEDEELSAHKLLTDLLQDEDVRRFLQVNRHQDVTWFNKESFEELVWWLMFVATLSSEEPQSDYKVVRALLHAEKESNYQVGKLLQQVETKSDSSAQEEHESTGLHRD